jgi:hypothetical protein
MSRLRTVGWLWLGAAAFAVLMTLTYRVDSTQIAVSLVLALVTAVLGLWMIFGRAADARVSIVLGIAWIVVYAALAIIQADEVAALVTDVFLAVIGAIAAGLAWTSRGVGPQPAEP